MHNKMIPKEYKVKSALLILIAQYQELTLSLNSTNDQPSQIPNQSDISLNLSLIAEHILYPQVFKN